MRPGKNLRGCKFGRLVPIAEFCKLGLKQRKIFWICKCDCGNFTEVVAQSLSEGYTTSCGCFQKEKTSEIAQKILRLPQGESGFNYLLSNYRGRANNKGISFFLSKEEFRNLTKQACHYCGVAPSQVLMVQTRQYTIGGSLNSKYIYNGIDRKNSDEGYTIDNCVACCKICNRAKLDDTYEDFLVWINNIKNPKMVIKI